MARQPFNVVVLDGYTLTADDLSWEQLQDLAITTVYDRTTASQIVGRSHNADAVLINKVALTAQTINQLPQLRYVGVTATGTNIVDLPAATDRGITVTNVPGYATPSVAQTVFAHLLNLAQRVEHHADAVREGKWSASPDFCFWETPQVEIAGLTIGIVGFGAIGQEVAKIALAFGMNVMATSRSLKEHPGDILMVDIDTLFQAADVVTLHCPLTPDTKEIVNQRRLSMMKSSAFLINTGRGPLIDEQALAQALAAGQIAGAGLDVLSCEPPPVDHPLLAAPNCFVTPHFAWATRRARERLLHEVVENVAAYLKGHSRNVVN